MNNARSFQRLAAVTAIISAPVAIINNILGLLVVDFNFDGFSDTILILKAGAGGAILWHWAMIFDMFGYYLLIAPLTLFLWRWLKPQDPDRVRLFSLCGLVYILIGAIGAAILAAVIPPLMTAYGEIPEQTMTLEVVFSTFMNAVYIGLWNILEAFVGGLGWIGIGLFLRRQRPAIGTTTVILGLATLTDSIGTVTGISALAEPALFIYLLLAPIWALWLGIDLLRRPVEIRAEQSVAANIAPSPG